MELPIGSAWKTESLCERALTCSKPFFFTNHNILAVIFKGPLYVPGKTRFFTFCVFYNISSCCMCVFLYFHFIFVLFNKGKYQCAKSPTNDYFWLSWSKLMEGEFDCLLLYCTLHIIIFLCNVFISGSIYVYIAYAVFLGLKS